MATKTDVSVSSCIDSYGSAIGIILEVPQEYYLEPNFQDLLLLFATLLNLAYLIVRPYLAFLFLAS